MLLYISSWNLNKHLNWNLSKTELVFVFFFLLDSSHFPSFAKLLQSFPTYLLVPQFPPFNLSTVLCQEWNFKNAIKMSLSFLELILDSKYPHNKVQISWYDMKGFPDHFAIHIYYILHFLTQIFYFQINHTMYTLWKFPQLSFCVDYYTS